MKENKKAWDTKKESTKKIKLNENTSTFADYEMNHDMRVELTKK